MKYLSNLKRIRKERKLTQTEVAKMLSIPYQQYLRYEHGINEIPIHYLIELCKFYKISSDTLLGIDYEEL